MPMSQKKNPRAAIVMQLMQNVRVVVTTDTRERFAPLETLRVIRVISFMPLLNTHMYVIKMAVKPPLH